MRALLQRLAVDTLIRLQLATAVIVAVLYVPSVLSPQHLEAFSDAWLCPALMIWPLVASFAGWGALPKRERPAWQAMSAGLVCWMAALLVSALWPLADRTPLASGLVALLYICYYVGTFLALTRLADAEAGRADSTLEQRLSALGLVLFVGGWVAYLNVVAGVLERGFSSGSIIDAPMSVVLGLAVMSYAAWRWQMAPSARGRTLAGAIALASAALLISDVLNMLVAFGIIRIRVGAWTDVFWAFPSFALLAALRLRALHAPNDDPAPADAHVRTPIAMGIGLMFASLSFPVVHSILRLAGYLSDRNHAALVAMESVLIFFSVSLVTLAAVTHWLLERQSATLQRDRAALIERLDEAQKHEAIGRLAGGVAHDFNNLLTVIGGTSDLLLFDDAHTPETRELLRLNREAVDRATGLTRQLLVFSRRQVSAVSDIDVSAVVQETAGFIRRLAGEAIRVEMYTAPHLPSVRINKVQFEQVVMNLVVNARDAMPGGGRLTITTRVAALTARDVTSPAVTPGDYVAVSVSDTGPGIDDAVRPHIFEPFFTTKINDGSRGVGLATAFGIIAQQAGAFHVDTAPGRGTTFTFYLPSRPAAPAVVHQPAARPATRPVSADNGHTVLLVEDDAGVRTLTRNLLKTRGYRVIDAASPLEALAHCEPSAPHIHVLLTDVIMPEMSGVELARRIEEVRPGIRVLFMSGYPDDQLMQLGVDRHQFNFIAKPFTIEGLAAKLREIRHE